MADDTSTTSTTEVTVMSAEQVSELITAITTSLAEIKTAVVSELSSIKTNITAIKTQLQTDTNNLAAAIGTIKTQIETSANTVATKIDTTNTKLNDLKTSLNSNTTSFVNAIGNVADKLEVDITPSNLNLEYESKTGVKSIAFVEASKHVLTLKRIKEANEDDGSSDDGGDSGSSSQDPAESEEAAAVNEEVRQNATEVFEELVGYEFGVTDGERITFKTSEDFAESRTGLSFDYTRMFYTNSVGVVDDTEVNEYALLVFDSLVKTSEKSGENGVQRMKNWVDRKVIQTVVLTTNTLSGACIVYFPTQDSYEALDTETYKTEKDAMDAIVKKYQEIIEDQYKGIAFIPVKDIEPGVTLEEYRTAAKNITPTCEYT